MSSSTLDLDGDEAPVTGLGHGTAALGPSDSSDSGSDVVGGPGMDEGLSDEQSREMPMTTTQGTGRDFGDIGLQSDSDREGTGERGSSGMDTTPIDQQINVRPGTESGSDEFDDPDGTDLVEVSDESSDPDVAAERDGESSVDDGAT